ncbi:MAG: hypothetical protein EOP37_10740 [Rubrivivax sp.]|nr:MAG: hypothetical protein EOP37_10740 [Rubrivivax sp.]
MMIYVGVAVVAFDPLAYFLAYEFFYGFIPRFSLFLIRAVPGFWFVPESPSLDALVELTKSLGRTFAIALLFAPGVWLAYVLGRRSAAS